jgi:hypothetical protein
LKRGLISDQTPFSMSQEAVVQRGRDGENTAAEVELPRVNGADTAEGHQEVDATAPSGGDLEAGNGTGNKKLTQPTVDPAKLLDPIRTNPIKALEVRKRRLDRQADSMMPEIHYVGQIASGRNITTDLTEGAFCRFYLFIYCVL